MSLARGDRRTLSNLFERQTAPNSRDDHFAFFVRQGFERPSGQLRVNRAFALRFEPQPCLTDRSLFVAVSASIAPLRADRTISHDAIEPCRRPIRHSPLSHELQERLLNDVGRSGYPLRRKQFKSCRMTVKQCCDNFRRYPTHPGKRFQGVID